MATSGIIMILQVAINRKCCHGNKAVSKLRLESFAMATSDITMISQVATESVAMATSGITMILQVATESVAMVTRQYQSTDLPVVPLV